MCAESVAMGLRFYEPEMAESNGAQRVCLLTIHFTLSILASDTSLGWDSLRRTDEERILGAGAG